MSNASNVITLNITHFPQNLIIPNVANVVSVNVINNSNKNENYQLTFEGENLEITIKPEEFNKKVAYHDPCDLGRALGIYNEPRNILKSIPGLEFYEFDRNYDDSRCCGSGGGLKAYDDGLSVDIGTQRLTEVLEKKVDIVVSACPACAMNFQHSSTELRKEEKGKIKIMDITEVIARAI